MLDDVMPVLSYSQYGLAPSEIRGMSPRLIQRYLDFLLARLREASSDGP